MKKLLLLALLVTTGLVIHAQTTPKADSLGIYVGKYKFAPGNPVAEVTISIENGGLYATSDAGNSELKRVEGDVFDVIAYNGKATFKRNPEGKIIGITVEVDDTVMEGTKTETLQVSAASPRSIKLQ